MRPARRSDSISDTIAGSAVTLVLSHALDIRGMSLDIVEAFAREATSPGAGAVGRGTLPSEPALVEQRAALARRNAARAAP